MRSKLITNIEVVEKRKVVVSIKQPSHAVINVRMTFPGLGCCTLSLADQPPRTGRTSVGLVRVTLDGCKDAPFPPFVFLSLL
jgi:hypothetical protein